MIRHIVYPISAKQLKEILGRWGGTLTDNGGVAIFLRRSCDAEAELRDYCESQGIYHEIAQ